jgi:hypothetical protein
MLGGVPAIRVRSTPAPDMERADTAGWYGSFHASHSGRHPEVASPIDITSVAQMSGRSSPVGATERTILVRHAVVDPHLAEDGVPLQRCLCSFSERASRLRLFRRRPGQKDLHLNTAI